ncbi:MAG: hypothetical protein JWN86_1752 [Planctomycetota bacterium]|nr:hypothetical protein [Planctomycetota bacterium]
MVMGVYFKRSEVASLLGITEGRISKAIVNGVTIPMVVAGTSYYSAENLVALQTYFAAGGAKLGRRKKTTTSEL